MTIFKEKLEEEYLTVSEAKELLEDLEAERAEDEDREMRYEVARAVEHVNRFATLTPEESRDLVEDSRPWRRSTRRRPTRSRTCFRRTATNSARCTPRSGTPSPATNSTRYWTSSRSTPEVSVLRFLRSRATRKLTARSRLMAGACPSFK